MSAIAEQDAAADTIEATVNYILNNGEEVFTYSGGPGSTGVRQRRHADPHRVVFHNGRADAGRFELDRDSFRFVRHDTKVADFFDEAEVRSRCTVRWKSW